MENLRPMFEKEDDKSYSMDCLSLRKMPAVKKTFLAYFKTKAKSRPKKTAKSTLMENFLPKLCLKKEKDRSYSMDRLSLRKNARGQKPFLL